MEYNVPIKKQKIDVTGRFYNAPSHLIIISDLFSVTPASGGHDNRDDAYYQAKIEKENERERKASERERIAEEKRRAKDAERAARKIAAEKEASIRDEKSRAMKADYYKNHKPKAQGKKLDTTYRRLDYRPKKIKPEAQAVPRSEWVPPDGYVHISKIHGITAHGIILAIEKNKLRSIKHSRRWYVIKTEAEAYVASSAYRRKANSIIALANARKSRKKMSIDNNSSRNKQ